MLIRGFDANSECRKYIISAIRIGDITNIALKMIDKSCLCKEHSNSLNSHQYLKSYN